MTKEILLALRPIAIEAAFVAEMLRAIDADTHIFESPPVWDFLDETMHPRRPIVLSGPRDTVYRRGSFWLIDGNIFPRSAGKGGFLLGTPTEPGQLETTPDVRARELTDIAGRIEAMDAMGVESQVVYPTLFLAYVTDDAGLEVALCRSYNRFMAGVWQTAEGRLRWVVVPPLRCIDAAIDEINVAKAHGAVGVFFRGIERDRTLDDPYFFPVYREAARLDMPICVHTGAGCPAFSAIFDVTRSHTFPHTRTLPLMAFRNLVANKIPELFPELRFGFIEAGASWVPYVLHALRSVFGGSPDAWGPKLFEEYRLYTTYEEWEDLLTWQSTWGRITCSSGPTGATTAAVGVAATRPGNRRSSRTCDRERMSPTPSSRKCSRTTRAPFTAFPHRRAERWTQVGLVGAPGVLELSPRPRGRRGARRMPTTTTGYARSVYPGGSPYTMAQNRDRGSRIRCAPSDVTALRCPGAMRHSCYAVQATKSWADPG